ncbi:MAG: bifunctional UDP-N-acetylglucosamine diphosphorylase/glucosamine-1-phosphate N-acetyltransferase GlmU, partial [Helicobacter sp.]|nr:bifunctional UDP-N-acetylglucosamine diphosphorylase/glucosamine-1-phosphate N-acetyltransferase GlmU [Helicobacter sp.]
VMSVLELANSNPSCGYGRVLIHQGKVTAIIEEKDADTQTLALKTLNAGIYCFHKDILDTYIPKIQPNNTQKEYYLTDIISLAVNDKKTITPLFVSSETFKGVNNPLELAKAEEILGNRIKEFWLEKGVKMRLMDTIYIEDDVEFYGECMIENGVSICGQSTIINSIIKAHSVIESSYIENSSIGPLAHIRPQSKIHDTHIGNFVEVKNSTLQGTKAGHLSYIGDCKIHEGSNIGAGFITCNYNGKKKYATTIGKNVFVGSGTQIVAPIQIEDDCLIGAGSTVRRNIKKGQLYLNKGQEVIKENFFYDFFNHKSSK